MATLYSNNAVAHLAATAPPGSTEFTVATGYGNLFPNPTVGDQFYVRLGTDFDNEVVRISARNADTFICNPTTQNWGSKTPVILTVCAELLEGVFEDTRDATVTAVEPLVTICEDSAAATAADRIYCDNIAAEMMGDAFVYISDDPLSVKLGVGTSILVTEISSPYPAVKLSVSVTP